MKLAMVMLTRNDESAVTVNGRNMESSMALTVTQRGVRLCLLLLLACAAGLTAGSWWYSRFPVTDAEAANRFLQSANPLLRVESWDRSEPLKRGQRVVFASAFAGSMTVAEVAATPNETVVLRRGNALDSLLLLGADKYYLVAANGSGRVVNGDEIRGVYRESAGSRGAM